MSTEPVLPWGQALACPSPQIAPAGRRDTAAASRSGSGPMRVAFILNAQIHQVLHSLPIAAALARAYPWAEVDVLAPTREHLAYIARLLETLEPAPVRLLPMRLRRLLHWLRRLGRSSVPPKLLTLLLNAPALARYDALIVPERTSLWLKRLRLSRAPFIHTDHGAGDRAVGFEPRIREFDFVLVAGSKQEQRMREQGLIRTGRYAVVGYTKFEAVGRLHAERPRLFGDDRPVVLYNPHFDRRLASWDRFGMALVEAVSASGRYNLILAPHVRLCEGSRRKWDALLAPYRDRPDVLVDPGSERSVDMTYTLAADLYVGDVSSQVYEFIHRPRPCLFLNAHGADWRGDPNYLHWNFGPVIDHPENLLGGIEYALRSHAAFAEIQRREFRRTFDTGRVPASERAAAAIADFLGSHG